MSQLVEDLRRRLAAKERVAVVGGNTKSFLGGRLLDEPVSMQEHSGIVNYEPTELVLTAKSGTALTVHRSSFKVAINTIRITRIRAVKMTISYILDMNFRNSLA